MQEYSLIKIKPCDNTFFGDGNQFDFDISNVLRSKNVPYPSVFFGAIFSALLVNDEKFMQYFLKHKYNLEELIKLQKETLEIEQVYLYNEKYDEAYIKAPLDIFTCESDVNKIGKFKEIKEKRYYSSKYDYIMCTPIHGEYKKANNYYIKLYDIFTSYKHKSSMGINLIHEDKIFKKNIKVGIGIDDKNNTTKDGMLYKIEQTEFINNDWSYLVQYKLKANYQFENNIKNLTKGFLKLGGENKVCRYDVIKNQYINKIVEENFLREKNKIKSNEVKGKIKIILTMDCYFEKLVEKLFDEKGLRVLGISNDKPIYIGGYDMVSKNGKGAIRKMYKGYSAGTVILAEPNGNEEITYNYVYNILKNEDYLCKNVISQDIKGFNKVIVFEEEN